MNAIRNSSLAISTMSPAEIRMTLEWAQKEGWNPGLKDASAFHAADATGFFIGKLNETAAATISAVKYGASFGFIGLYIVREEFRGLGLGFQIWEAAIASLGNRNIGLDGVLAQQDNYKKSGFKFAHRNIRYVGKSKKLRKTSPRIVEARHLDFSAIEAYDRMFFPEERKAFLESWIRPENSHTLAIAEHSKVIGYGSIRACRHGFKIGPLNAESSDGAFDLFSALISMVPEGSDVFLDIPEPNRNAIHLAQESGMSPVFETARMYTRISPPMPLHNIYGITTFELG